MKRRDAFMLVLLAALWGGSYLFLRLGAADFGPVALAGVRAAGAAVLLVPLVGRRRWAEARGWWREIGVAGIAQSALPYLLFGYAALTLPAGISAILTATTPLFAAGVARVGWGEPLTRMRAMGFAAGLLGVLWLMLGRGGAGPEGSPALLPVAACLAGAFLYGWAANFTRHRLGRVSPLTVAAGSQVASALVLAVPAVVAWPDTAPGWRAWTAAIGLAAACTALAYVLFYRLVARVGAARTVTVTFLIPLFGVLWGAWLLDEAVTLPMLGGGVVILIGTWLSNRAGRRPGERERAEPAGQPACARLPG